MASIMDREAQQINRIIKQNTYGIFTSPDDIFMIKLK